MKKLTPKQKAFADNYLINGFNATQAYKDAGYKWKNENVAKTSASQLLSNPNVNDYISKRMNRIEKKVETKQVDLQEELNKMIMQWLTINQEGVTSERIKSIEPDERTGLPTEVTRTKQSPKPADVLKAMELKLKFDELAQGRQVEDDKLDSFINSLEEQANE